jgi:hypothetical protein
VLRDGVIPPLERPLHRPAPQPSLLYHPNRGQGRDRLCQPAQGLLRRRCHTRQSATPQPTARRWSSGQAGHQPPRQPFRTQTGLVFRPPGLCTFISGAAERTPGNRFSQPSRSGLRTPWAGYSFPASTLVVPAAPAETTSEDRPLTLPPPSPSLGGAQWRAAYAPGPGPAPADNVVSTHVPCTVNSLACIYSGMYSVINQYCLNRCPYCYSSPHCV